MRAHCGNRERISSARRRSSVVLILRKRSVSGNDIVAASTEAANSWTAGCSPPMSAAASLALNDGLHAAHNGCSPSRVRTIAKSAVTLSAPATSRAGKSEGTSGASQGTVTSQPAPWDCAHWRPANTPDSGPLAVLGGSGKKWAPIESARSLLPATASADTLSRIVLATWVMRDTPANSARALFVPKRRLCPPARISPYIARFLFGTESRAWSSSHSCDTRCHIEDGNPTPSGLQLARALRSMRPSRFTSPGTVPC
jgi:hypothetical protein